MAGQEFVVKVDVSDVSDLLLRGADAVVKVDVSDVSDLLLRGADALESLGAERDALRARITALESWLSEHGQHLSGCRYGEQRPDAECTCGLEALIDG